MRFYYNVKFAQGSTPPTPVITGVATTDLSWRGFKGSIEAPNAKDALVAVARGVFPSLAGTGAVLRGTPTFCLVIDSDPETGPDNGVVRGSIVIKAAKR